MEVSRIDSKIWDCPICKDVMTSEVAISKRCFHVFHDSCIRQWVDDYKGECPSCRLPNFCNVEIISNPSFVEQYNLWKSNPDNYNLNEDLLRPEALRSLERRETFTRPELEAYRDEIRRQLEALDTNSSDEKIQKIRIDLDKVEDLLLNDLEEKNREQIQKLASINEKIDRVEEDRRHIDFAKSFTTKLEAIDKRAEDKIKEVESTYPIDWELVNKLRSFTIELCKYNPRLSEAAQTNYTNPDNPTPEESRQLLRNVDAEMEAFIQSQPEVVKNAIREPQPSFQPVIVQLPQANLKLKPVFKIMLLVAGIFVIYAAVRYGRAKNTLQKPKLPKSDF